MKAVGFKTLLPISEAASFIDVDIKKPTPGPHDLRVTINSICVNPVDFKILRRLIP